MSVFGLYAQYYDALYHDKNYQQEVAYVYNLIQEYLPAAKSILELGCGTGGHAFHLAHEGYEVHGVDLSKEMIASAQQKGKQQNEVTFSVGDLRTLQLNKQFDVVISLFHVMNYQTTDADLHNAFKTAEKHLKKGGLFLFDFWYGPAVIHEKPLTRIKRCENENIKITRIAEPQHHKEKNSVDVNFTLFLEDKKNQKISEIKENHCMRYFFEDELRILFEQNNFEVISFEEWLTGKKPVNTSWGVCAVGRKQ